MTVQPQTGIAMPEINGDKIEEVPGTNGRVRRGSSLFDGLTIRAQPVKIVCSPCMTTQSQPEGE